MTRKIITRIAASIAAVLVLSSCRVDSDITLAVKPNGTGTISVVITADKDIIAKAPGLKADIRTDDLVAAGWKVEGPTDTKDGGLTITLTHDFLGPAEATTLLGQINGTRGPLHEMVMTRTGKDTNSTYTLAGRLEVNGGLEAFADDATLNLLGGAPYAADVQAAGLDLGDLGTALHQCLDVCVGNQQLIKTDSSLVAHVITVWATLCNVQDDIALGVGILPAPRRKHRSGGDRRAIAILGEHQPRLGFRQNMGLLTGVAKPPRQTLRKDARQAIGKIEGVQTQIEQAHDGLGGAIGMQGGEHHVAGQRGLNCDLGGLGIAYLSDHDHIRISPQKAAQGGGECPADLGVDLHLAQTRLGDFDRIFGRPYLRLTVIELPQQRMQRGGLARTGRTADEKQPLRFGNQAPQLEQRPGLEPELVHRERRSLCEDAQHDVLQAVSGRDDGDAQLDVTGTESAEVNLSILGLAPLRDIQLRHDLDARNHGAAKTARNIQVGNEYSVLAKANVQILPAGIGLKMDIRRLLLYRIHENLVDQAHQRAVVLYEQFFRQAGVARLMRQAGCKIECTQLTPARNGVGRCFEDGLY